MLFPSGMAVSGTGGAEEEVVVDVRLFGMIHGGRDEVLPFSLVAGVLKQLLCWESLPSKGSHLSFRRMAKRGWGWGGGATRDGKLGVKTSRRCAGCTGTLVLGLCPGQKA